jgi:hypothetical protein
VLNIRSIHGFFAIGRHEDLDGFVVIADSTCDYSVTLRLN